MKNAKIDRNTNTGDYFRTGSKFRERSATNERTATNETIYKNKTTNYRYFKNNANRVNKIKTMNSYDILLILTTAALVKTMTTKSIQEKLYHSGEQTNIHPKKTTGLQMIAAELPAKWDSAQIDVLEDLNYEQIEWRFDKKQQRQIVMKMPDGNYLIWRLLQNPYRFEMEPITNPKTLPESKLFRDLHLAFHELEAKYKTLVRVVAGETIE